MKKIIYTILFLNILFSQDHWETAIFASDEWKYIVPDAEPSSNWNEVNFDEATWINSQGGFGYGDGDDGTIIGPAISVYFRKFFNVFDKNKLSCAILSADYDDGYIAYLNGIEISRSYNLPEPGIFVSFDETTYSDHEASLYNGGLPDNIFLDSLFLNNLLVDGENVLAIQVHNVGMNSSDMSGNFFLTFGIADDSEYYSQPPSWFQEPIVYDESNLPIVAIDTYGFGIPDEPRISAYMGIIDNQSGINHIDDPFNDYDGHITIERRGNSSQWNDKTPYRFETVDAQGENNNVELLGMPEENDWVLYAPWQDKTMIRNVLIYKLSNQLGRYASKTRFVELYLNNEYQGVYVLMEKIKRDSERVSISKLGPEEISGDDVTGGYILKFDWYYTGDNIGGFESDYDGMIYNYHYPKPSDIVEEQEAYIQNYINNFENIMLSNNYADESNGYPSIMNVESFVDFILLQELAKNVDAYRLSTYMFKDKESIDNRLTAGPVWDFNHGFGNCDYGETWETDNWLLEYNPEGGDQMAFWWELLWQDENFQLKAAQRYTDLRSTVLSEENINSVIDSSVLYLGDAIERNFLKWPILGNYVWPNYYVFDTYEEEIEYLKSWIQGRLNWMDNEILLLSTNQNLKPISDYSLVRTYPNPFNPKINFSFEIYKPGIVSLNIYDLSGREIKKITKSFYHTGPAQMSWFGRDKNGNNVVTGAYIYELVHNQKMNRGKIVYLK
ncbi:MAG: CotH kinase family protein [Candidatus Neomarinimicrobiota bacterium]